MPKTWSITQPFYTINTCNELSTTFTHDLLINSPVIVYQKGNADQLKANDN